MTDRIMYVCSQCADHNPEGCGHYRREDLRVVGDEWLCDGCFDASYSLERLCWNDYPPPREYAPLEGT